MKSMRDVLIERIYHRMKDNDKIFFLSADMGAPMLDSLRADFKDRFINVGIAEQNLINIAAGLGLEGFVVYVYLIAPFVLRAYEQIRINLAMSSQIRPVNVNILSMGTGLSYVVSGPTHHCIEDLAVMRVLPNMTVVSPSDCVQAGAFVDYSLENTGPKFIRLDGKPLPDIYPDAKALNFDAGFAELSSGSKVCLISTGYMTHRALRVARKFSDVHGIEVGVIDVFKLKPMDSALLLQAIQKYDCLVTLEEGLLGCGGLDSLVAHVLMENRINMVVQSLGIRDSYVFELGDRDRLHKLNGMDDDCIEQQVMALCAK